MREGTYGIVPLFWINSIGMCIVLLNVARKLLENNNRGSLRNGLVAIYLIIINIGRRSLVFLCLNQVMIAIAFKWFPIRNGVNGIEVLVHNTIVLFIVLMVLYLLAIIREKVVRLKDYI